MKDIHSLAGKYKAWTVETDNSQVSSTQIVLFFALLIRIKPKHQIYYPSLCSRMCIFSSLL